MRMLVEHHAIISTIEEASVLERLCEGNAPPVAGSARATKSAGPVPADQPSRISRHYRHLAVVMRSLQMHRKCVLDRADETT